MKISTAASWQRRGRNARPTFAGKWLLPWENFTTVESIHQLAVWFFLIRSSAAQGGTESSGRSRHRNIRQQNLKPKFPTASSLDNRVGSVSEVSTQLVGLPRGWAL